MGRLIRWALLRGPARSAAIPAPSRPADRPLLPRPPSAPHPAADRPARCNRTTPCTAPPDKAAAAPAATAPQAWSCASGSGQSRAGSPPARCAAGPIMPATRPPPRPPRSSTAAARRCPPAAPRPRAMRADASPRPPASRGRRSAPLRWRSALRCADDARYAPAPAPTPEQPVPPPPGAATCARRGRCGSAPAMGRARAMPVSGYRPIPSDWPCPQPLSPPLHQLPDPTGQLGCLQLTGQYPEQLAPVIQQKQRRGVIEQVCVIEVDPVCIQTPGFHNLANLLRGAGQPPDTGIEETQISLEPIHGIALRVQGDEGRRRLPATVLQLVQGITHPDQRRGTDVGAVGETEEHQSPILGWPILGHRGALLIPQ